MAFGYLGCACQGKEVSLSGFGSYGATGIQIASSAAMGAKIGSAVPVVGTAIGAAAGAIISAITGLFGSRDVRVSGAQKAQCQQMVNGYIQLGNQAGAATLGPQMGLAQLEQLHWCLSSLYGAPVYNIDPRYFQVGTQHAEKLAAQIVQAAMTMQPGSTVNMQPVSGCPADGRSCFTFNPPSVQVPNPPTLESLGEQLRQLMIGSCQCCGTKYGAACPTYWSQPGMARWCFDMVGFVVGRDYPQAFQSATAASAPASAPAAAPILSAPVPVAQLASPVSPSSPVVTTAASVPVAMAAPGAVDVNALVQQLAAQGANQQQQYAAALQALQNQGIPPTAAVQQQVASAVTSAGGISGLPTWLIGGALAFAALMFATARPASPVRR